MRSNFNKQPQAADKRYMPNVQLKDTCLGNTASSRVGTGDFRIGTELDAEMEHQDLEQQHEGQARQDSSTSCLHIQSSYSSYGRGAAAAVGDGSELHLGALGFDPSARGEVKGDVSDAESSCSGSSDGWGATRAQQWIYTQEQQQQQQQQRRDGPEGAHLSPGEWGDAEHMCFSSQDLDRRHISCSSSYMGTAPHAAAASDIAASEQSDEEQQSCEGIVQAFEQGLVPFMRHGVRAVGNGAVPAQPGGVRELPAAEFPWKAPLKGTLQPYGPRYHCSIDSGM